MKDRERTEKKILDAVGSIIASDGFEGIGINAVAQQAGVSKMLIYRYFEGLNELISSYLLQKDYWVNTNIDFRESSDISESLKRPSVLPLPVVTSHASGAWMAESPQSSPETYRGSLGDRRAHV